jgi:hypothetical protein
MDHLQQPLQPLMDNLEGETYEGFEKDPIKYRQYEEAVYRALCDRSQNETTCVFFSFVLDLLDMLTVLLPTVRFSLSVLGEDRSSLAACERLSARNDGSR